MVTHLFAIYMSISVYFEKEQCSMYCIVLTYHLNEGAAISRWSDTPQSIKWSPEKVRK